ncbi:hypothetical protein NDU88_002801 [Pleurodeles waltl]|uniref:Uncharacterized protein n=1 Tax=Pleurodeles waltl TaxID=8319 RepID=A0AAV7UBK6_PLEWA|nr:hypothetical protein NDU88_002801 [Pleurodeles waltl]
MGSRGAAPFLQPAYPEGPRPGSPLDQGGFPCQFGFRGSCRAPTGQWGGNALSPACRTLRGPGLGVHRAKRGLPCQFGLRGHSGPQVGSPCPGLCPLDHQVARHPGQCLGRTPMHGCAQRAPPGPCRALGRAVTSSSLPHPQGPRPGSPLGPVRLPLPVWVQGHRPVPTGYWGEYSLSPACRTLRGPDLGVHRARGGFPCQFGFRSPSRAPTGPWGGHSLPPACRTLRGPDLGVHWAWGGFPYQFGFRGPSQAPTGPWGGCSLPPACRTLRGPGLGVHWAKQGFPCQCGLRGPGGP